MDAPEPTADAPARTGPPRYLRVLGLLAVGFVIGQAAARLGRDEPIVVADPTPLAPELARSDRPAKSGGPLTGDALLRSRLAGVWTAQSHGTQVCTLRPDGTGTNAAELDWMASLIYGSKLTMDIAWSVEDGHLIQELQGGEPADMVAKLTKDFGAVKRYEVRDLSPSKAVLVDTADGDAVVWTRVE